MEYVSAFCLFAPARMCTLLKQGSLPACKSKVRLDLHPLDGLTSDQVLHDDLLRILVRYFSVIDLIWPNPYRNTREALGKTGRRNELHLIMYPMFGNEPGKRF